MATGYCALCLSSSKLSNSHIIPNAYFRHLKREKSGRLIAIDSSKDRGARYSTESWPEHLLCDSCEGRFSSWETPSIDSLRRSSRQAEKHMFDGGFHLHRFNYETLRLFLLSILWRAGVSTLHPFSTVVLEDSHQEQLRLLLLNATVPDHKHFACRLRKLIHKNDTVSMRVMESVLVSPPKPEFVGTVAIYTFLFGGYVVDYFVPYAPFKYCRKSGVISRHTNQFVPVVPLMKVPHLVDLLAMAIRKEQSGDGLR